MNAADSPTRTGTEYRTILVKKAARRLHVTISRPERNNSIDTTLIRELGAAIEHAESTSDCRTVVLEGAPGLFCTGMDFQEVAENADVASTESVRIADYLTLLKRFTETSRVIVSVVDGKVIAGGVGLVAASDFVIATSRSEFSLSEALWGLLPCCVIPFLIRRVGFQKAYSMTLTTRPVEAAQAQIIHLVDELSDSPDESLRKLGLRLNLLESQTIVDLKAYFRKMWILSQEMERTAVEEISRLAAQPHVQENIVEFARNGTFPWERRR